MRRRAFIVGIAAVVLMSGLPARASGRRALLIGINDYSASRIPALRHAPAPGRAVPNLDGAVHDVEIMRELLVALYGFKAGDVVTLTDQQATRGAILGSLQQHLLAAAQKDDVVFFYFSGHGSQVRNSLSSEADHLDESLVPADSRQGSPDIRDKELLPLFNGILDRGARLTIVLDTCHSGSGARGLNGGLQHRAVEPDLRDVADRSTGQPPERRGALIFSAAQDFDLAFETLDDQGEIRGAFTWALARALRDAEPGESAADTFLRAQARLHAERPAQDPVIAGGAEARSRPFLGVRIDRRDHGPVIAVERAAGPASYLLQGGWASGLTLGSELRALSRGDTRLEVTSLLGISRCMARVSRGTTPLQPGALLEIVTWAAPPSPPLRVWIPPAPDDLFAFARALRDEAARRGIRWIDDPTAATPTHLLRPRDGAWELVTKDRRSKAAAPLLAGVPAGASLFLQLPAPAPLVEAIGTISGIETTSGPETADYVLAGRFVGGCIEYAWVRPSVTASDRARSILPLRTAWTAANRTVELREGVVRLRRVQGWHDLRSPAASASHYRLAVQRADDGELVEDGTLIGNKRYRLVLRERRQGPAEPLYACYVYAFVIDSNGKSSLLFPAPETGDVENLLPSTPTPGQPVRQAPAEIQFAGTRPFIVSEPYGIDTFFLLSTDEPLLSLTSLEWRGVRGPRADAKKHPLEELLAQTISGTRAPGEPILTPPTWSIDRITFESVPPRRAAR
jgi:caspase domain-containing protein